MKRSIAAFAVSLCMLALVGASTAYAQTYPTKPVRLVIPYPAGGLTDILGRAIAQEVAKTWGQPLLVENRPGANQIIAAEAVARASPDGYTILLVDMTAVALNPLLYNRLPYDPNRDFAPVLNLVRTADVLLVHPSFPANTLQEFIKVAREKPGQIDYGSFGLGSLTHVDMEALSALAGIKLNHVPYKGIADVLPALASGQVQAALSGVPPLLPLLRQGRVKALAISGAQRSPQLPDVPTFAEAGLPGFTSQSWFGLVVPSGTPRPIIDKLAADIGRVIVQPQFAEKYITGVGLELLNQPPAQFAEVIRADQASYAARMKGLNIKLD